MGSGASELWRWQHAHGHAPEFSLEPIGFGAIPGWEEDDHGAALRCFLASAPQISAELAALAAAASANGEGAPRAFFEENFSACRVLAEPGLLTAYYEPVLEGSRHCSPAYSVPVYRRPPDLSPLPQGHALAAAGLTAGRVGPRGLEPYFTRGEIENGALSGRGLELLFLADPVAAYFMHVQGSGAVKLAEGGAARLTFDGKNGHPYTSVGKLLVARGELSVADATLDGLVNWLNRRPDEARTLLQENRSYIFFRELPIDAAGPLGSLGAPLTPGRSLAADPRCHRLGLPVWVSAPELEFEGRALRRLLVAQDTGSAITGPQRGDLFAGSGAEAGSIAGRVRHACEFVVLKPKAVV